jgi:hypothetical protein
MATTLILALTATAAFAQQPRITTFYPIGGKAGTTVEVEVRGGNLNGAQAMLVTGKGVTGTVEAGNAKIDEKFKPNFQQKCGGCHELRSFGNRSLTAAQWAATVKRMIEVRQAPISAEEGDKITQYLQSGARAGKVTAQVKIDPNILPGLYEMRLVTNNGVSTASLFEVGNLPEFQASNGAKDAGLPIQIPCVVNGTFLTQGERHFLKFAAKKGQRIVFNLKGYRYNAASQMFFNPNLRLYNAKGKEIAENHGFYELDPLLDWPCPEDGEYTLEVRDLLGTANPGSVYRLAVGNLPYDTVIYPAGGQIGQTITATVTGKAGEGLRSDFTLAVPDLDRISPAPSPAGPAMFFHSPYPVVKDSEGMGTAPPATAQLPSGFTGRILTTGEKDEFKFRGKGVYDFEAFAGRLSAPTNPRVAVLNAKGEEIGAVQNDNRMRVTIAEGQDYTLRVTDNVAGADRVYFVEARPAGPLLAAVARDANISLRPGLGASIQVILTQRDSVDGNVIVSADGLPAGVTASTAVIQPDRNIAYLVLKASPDAKPLEAPFRIYLSAKGPAGETKVLVQPQEEYRLNNDPRFYDREQCVVAVRGAPNFDVASLPTTPLDLWRRKETKVKVKLARKGDYKGPINMRISGLPSGWVCYQATIPADKDEIELSIRPDGNNPRPFFDRDKGFTPIRPIVEAWTDDFIFVIGKLEVKRPEKIDEDPQ